MSGMSDQSLAVFSQDAWRLLHESQDCVKRLTDLPAPDSSSLLWIELLEKIHTLKGTASMLQKTAPLADILHALEGTLVVRTRESTPNWIKSKQHSGSPNDLECQFRTRRRIPPRVAKNSGFWRDTWPLIACDQVLIPLDSVLRVLPRMKSTAKIHLP